MKIYLPYLGHVSASGEQALTLGGIIAALVLVLYWRQTGHFSLVGYLLRMLWLPVQLALWLFWLVCLLMRPPLGGWVVTGWIIYSCFVINPAWLPIAVFLILLTVFAKIFTRQVRTLAAWYPRARTRPVPRPKKPPVVKIAAKTGGRYEGEKQIIRQLPAHLQALILSPPVPPPPPEEAEGTEQEQETSTGKD